MVANKVCPVILRSLGAGREILAFEHPTAGYQIVKGTIEAGESIEAAAFRELAEETGITGVVIARHLGVWEAGYENQVWAFVDCRSSHPLPETWSHWTADDGGHTFRFFWHRLGGQTDSSRWHSVFRDALAFVESAV